MPDGRVKWILGRGVPNIKEDASIIWDTIGIDITDRKQTEDGLKESEERNRLFYNPSFGASFIHVKGVILDCSNGATNITGYSHN